MPFLQLIFALFLLFAQTAIAQDDPLPPDQAFKMSAKAISNTQLEISFSVADGYYLYRNKMQFKSKTEAVEVLAPDLPAGISKHDDIFGDVIIYRNNLTIPVAIKSNGATTLQLYVQYQGCADRGLCYPPQKKTIDLVLPQAEAAVTTNPLAFLTNKLSTLKAPAELLPAEQAYRFFATVKDANTLHVNWELADGYYLYREKVQLQLLKAAGVTIGPYKIPNGTPKHDEAFGDVEIFHNSLSFDVPLLRTSTNAQTITLQAGYQGCADRGVCYPPISKKLDLQLPQSLALKPLANPPAPAVSEQDQIVQSLQNDSFGMTLLSFFGFGLLLSMTPCIFPMIPILSGIIVGHGHRISTARAFLLSLSYVVASAITYTVFGVLAALFGSNLQTTFQQPWIIGLFSAIFVLLSLSMFGFYELELPNALKTKLHNSSERHRDGSMWGAAIMGALSSLIVGPCVAAPLAGALIFIGQSGNAWLGGSALFAMGMGMGVPLLLLGASAGKLLPKAGTWLYSTKAVFGVLMLGVAVWMLSRILPPAITLLLWAALLILPAIYLKAIDPLPEHSTGWHKLWKGVGLMMLAYGLLLLIGFSLGNTNPLKPLHGLGGGAAIAAEPEGVVFERIHNLAELEAKVAAASREHKRVMLDFYADWCISCKEMEAYTFTDPKVKTALAQFVRLQVDVTKDSDDDKALLAAYQLIGPPAILFFGTDGSEDSSHRVIGYQDAATFLNSLQGLKP
ncbi:MAG: protein-disulfide reductase DsbD [Methylococcaceae bacterium]|nr:protein-disulfide reductase DsbD [Methylococcaceae bacterium]